MVGEVYCRDRPAWRAWLEANHVSTDSIWLIFDKGLTRQLSGDDMVEEALCFGWIDSKPGKVDEHRSKIYMSKRKPKSVWSKINKDRIARLEAAGLMAPAGVKAVELAKANGSWDALNASDALTMPPALTAALQANALAQDYFDAFPPSSRRAILEWIYQAKTDSTRIKRIIETVELAAQNIRAHHYRQPGSK